MTGTGQQGAHQGSLLVGIPLQRNGASSRSPALARLLAHDNRFLDCLAGCRTQRIVPSLPQVAFKVAYQTLEVTDQ